MKIIEAKTGKTETIGGIEFVWIPEGEFLMGSPDGLGDASEKPRHKVKLNGFWMAKYLVTRTVYQNVMDNNPGMFKNEDNPVDGVSWDDAISFCARFKDKYGVEIRLPTEAEWEYACRAGTNTEFYWGDEMDDSYAWYYNNSDWQKHPVGQKTPNNWGLYDMSGNVWEWCKDWYAKDYYSSSPVNNPECTDASIGRKVVRGGSFYNGARGECRAAYRYDIVPFYIGGDVGFRPVKP